MSKFKEFSKSKGFKVIFNIIRAFFVIFIIVFVLVVYLQRFSDNKLSFFNYRMFTVVSPSMEPKYTIGDVLISKKVDPSTIEVGDDISYLGRIGDVRDKIVTHQVVKVEQTENGEYLFHAKGLGNLIEDPIIAEDQLYGIVVYKSFMLSAIYKIVNTNTGLYFCIVVPLIAIISYEIFVTLMEREEKKRQKIN